MTIIADESRTRAAAQTAALEELAVYCCCTSGTSDVYIFLNEKKYAANYFSTNWWYAELCQSGVGYIPKRKIDPFLLTPYIQTSYGRWTENHVFNVMNT